MEEPERRIFDAPCLVKGLGFRRKGDEFSHRHDDDLILSVAFGMIDRFQNACLVLALSRFVSLISDWMLPLDSWCHLVLWDQRLVHSRG